jgi:transposase
MTLLPAGVKVHLAFGYIDMRKGINGLAMLVQGVLRQDPFSGHLFVFRGRKANLGWHRPLPLHQAARARRIPLAVEHRPGWDDDAELGAVVDTD